MIKIGMIFLAGTLMLSACSLKDVKNEVSKTLDLDVSDGTVISSSDTHGGFHGDGTTYIALQFPEEELSDTLKQNRAWHEFPLSDTLTTLVYGKKEEQSQTGPFLTDDDGNTLIPEIKNGYYYFKDRNNNGGNSFNFTAAFYDTDSNTLYFCELDT